MKKNKQNLKKFELKNMKYTYNQFEKYRKNIKQFKSSKKKYTTSLKLYEKVYTYFEKKSIKNVFNSIKGIKIVYRTWKIK